MERCSMHLLYITELRFYIRVIFDAYGYQGSQGTGSSHVHIEVTNGKYGKAEISMDTVLKNQNPYSYWKNVLF